MNNELEKAEMMMKMARTNLMMAKALSGDFAKAYLRKARQAAELARELKTEWELDQTIEYKMAG